jgi:predicted MFS family arabinose efflux permease
MTASRRRVDWHTPTAILVASSTILMLAFGVRHGFGLFLQPMSADLHWGRETFAFAMAVQNLVWGIATPFAGICADRYGAHRVALVCAVLYAIGLVTMAQATTPFGLAMTAGVLIGIGLSGLAFSTMAGAIGRAYPPGKRSMALGISAAAGSFGQFAMLPLTQTLLSSLGWHGALVALAAIAALMIPLSRVMVDRVGGSAHAFQQSAADAVREAAGHRGYVLLTLGFFVCGFQVVFVGVHLPAYLADKGMAPHVAVTALALIGLFNIVGTWTSGWLGSRMPKRYILSAIYFGRALVFTLFLLAPVTPGSVYAFAVALGLLWLSTVPATNGIVAGVFGVRYLAMLSGITFLSHQVGSFLGAWLGGRLYDATGSYDVVWWISVALGVAAGLVNLPIDEREIRRPAVAAA